MTGEAWPALPYDEWKDTYATLHMWSQIVGKIALASAPPLNHCWGSALTITSRGLATPLLPHGDGGFALEFDFIAHQLWIRTSRAETRAIALSPRSVADFYREIIATMAEMSLPSRIWPVPVEIPDPVRFDQDTGHHSYDPAYVTRFWHLLMAVSRAFTVARCRFIGKTSPVQFFWGSFDLAVTRFSGRTAPPRDGPAFMRDAYSHEVISHGFWPGSAPVLEPAFYAYAVPEPAGLKEAAVRPDGAYYHRDLGEFILPYEAVRRVKAPEAAIDAFVQSTYDAAANLGNWDRRSLER